MIKCPIDIIQLIGLETQSTTDYLHLGLACKYTSGILIDNPRRLKAQTHFTKLTINKNGTKVWWMNGKIHRDNNLPAIIYADGAKEWYQYGRRHRIKTEDDIETTFQLLSTQTDPNGGIKTDNDIVIRKTTTFPLLSGQTQSVVSTRKTTI